MTSELEKAAHRYRITRAALDNRRDELAVEVRAAVNGGMSEVEAARLAGVSRMTVRSWLGKGAKRDERRTEA